VDHWTKFNVKLDDYTKGKTCVTKGKVITVLNGLRTMQQGMDVGVEVYILKPGTRWR
jgi:hypothetical protein